MMKFRARWMVPVAVAAAVVALAQHGWASPGSTDAAAPHRALSTDMQVTEAVPPDVVRKLAKLNVIVEPSSASGGVPTVSADDAAAIGRGGFGLDGDATAATASIATVTVTNMGRDLESDPTKPSRIVPSIDHREVWVINFPSVQVPALGGSLTSDTQLPPSEAGMVALVDPGNGEFLLAQTY